MKRLLVVVYALCLAAAPSANAADIAAKLVGAVTDSTGGAVQTSYKLTPTIPTTMRARFTNTT
ncbi:MAG TPA: hypothetical protein VEQ63_05510 [Bryobacteraceae bacterium]|nr:hypothetical protein [Bryobacteraceae bacterium]